MLLFLSLFACGEKSEDTAMVEDTAVDTSDTSDTNDTSDTSDTSDTNDTNIGDGGLDSLVAGDLIITEIMKNPCGIVSEEMAVNEQGDEYLEITCSDPQIDDAAGEWFEIYNNTDGDVNLNGLVVSEADDGDSNTDEQELMITADVVVAPGMYLVIGNSDDVQLNGGVQVSYVFSSDAFGLANGDDEIVLSNANGIIDAVVFTDADFPDLKGHSMALNPATMSDVDNDNGANWCNSVTNTLGSGDFGTPGTANPACQ